ncbi:MAG: RNA polymerase sigma factor [Acidimicrobiia bacterium]
MTDHSGLEADLARELDAAFPDLVLTYQDGLFATALRLTRSRHDAEELAQETLVRAYRALSGYDAQRIRELRLRGWLWTILLNLARNRARTRARRPPPAPLDGHETGAAHGDVASVATASVAVADALLTLRPIEREVLVLRYVADLAVDEVAEAIGRPVGTVKSHLHRSLGRLRSTLGEESR